jgi:NTE family protein
MKSALVLSGGGSKGAFQIGAIKKLYEKGINFDIVAGVSVGSLNGAMIAQDKFNDLLALWNKIQTKDIYHKYSTFRCITRVLFGKNSLYDAAPLYKLLQQNIKKADFKKKFYIGVTSLDSGNYTSLTIDDLEKDCDVHDAIFASALMPIYWSPVNIKTKSGILSQCVDGGLRNVTPLEDTLSELPDHIYIISCNRYGGVIDPDAPRKIIPIAKRTFLDIMLSEVVDTDVKELLKINSLVLEASQNGYVLHNPKNGKEYKYFETTIIEAPYNLGVPEIFDQELIQKNMRLGYDIVG